MAVALLPYRQPKKQFARLAEFRCEDLLWPLGRMTNARTVGELSSTDHVVMYSSSRAYTLRFQDVACRVSIMQMEPPAIQRRYYRLLKLLHGRFHRVLTHNSDLVRALPNGRFLPHGGTFLPTLAEPHVEKTDRIAMVASKKCTTEGHKLRHRLAQWSRQQAPDLKLFGYGYNPVDDKTVAHAPYWFSVVVENSRFPGYFTEKLIDCLLCRSLPIYWGAPDIAHFFDHRGMICCHDESELRERIANVTLADYTRRQTFLEENRRRALAFVDFHLNAARLLNQEDEVAGNRQNSEVAVSARAA